jgi:hypothetical protein
MEDVMKRFVLGAMAAALFMSMALFSYAQDPRQDPGAQKQEEPNRPREVSPPRQPEMNPPRGQEEAKPRRQEEAKPPRQEEAKPPRHEEAKPPKMDKQEARPSGEQQRPANEQRGTAGQQGHARPAGKSAHIPDPQFKAHFSKQHSFTVNRVITTTTVVPNQTQFVYSGYTFIFLDPWPAEWMFTDDCYIDYVDDEYYLFDAFHPGIRVALFVVE